MEGAEPFRSEVADTLQIRQLRGPSRIDVRRKETCQEAT